MPFNAGGFAAAGGCPGVGGGGGVSISSLPKPKFSVNGILGSGSLVSNKDLSSLFKVDAAATGTTTTVTMSNKSGIQTIMDLGCGYDVFDRYATGLSLKQPILDIDKLIGDGHVLRRAYAYGDFLEIEGSSLSAYSKQMTTTAKVSGGYMGFKASVESGFSSAYTSKSTSYYHTVNWLVKNDNLFIKSTTDLRQYVLPEIKEILDTGKLNGVAWTEKKIFDELGGYVLVDGIFGGKLEFNVAADSTYCTSFNTFNLNVKASYNAGFASISGEFDNEKAEDWEDFQSHSSTRVLTYGGTPQDGHVLSQSEQSASQLQAWNASIPSRQVLVEFGSNGASALKPIWELCSDPAGDRAKKLKDEFIKYANDPSRQLAAPVSVVKAGTVFELANYSGASMDLYAGRDYRNLGSVNIDSDASNPVNFDERISSIKVSPGYRVIAYSDTNFEGPFMIYGDNTSARGRVPGTHYIGSSGYSGNVSYLIDNKISSLVVETASTNNALAAVIYQDTNYIGDFQQLTVGEYPNMNKMFVTNDKASSIKVSPGFEITVYWDTDYKGPSLTFTSNVPKLSAYSYGFITWNDQISSMKVRYK